ncbi:MAG TPA: ABC transporter ATP-binding protein [Candidatus Xenobia bacterium]|jgi:subfamily B ATP-binding cassette protein MsbA
MQPVLKNTEEEMTSSQLAEVCRRFVGFARPQLPRFFMAIIAGLVMNGTTLLQPWLLKQLTDHVFVAKDPVYLQKICWFIMASCIGKGLFSYAQGYLMAWASQQTVTHIRDTVYRHLQALPMPFYDRVRVGDILSRFTADISMMSDALTSGLVSMLNDVTILVVALALMLWTSPGMTLLALIASPAIGFTLSKFGRMINQYAVRNQNRLSDLVSKMQETFTSMKVVKSFTREEYEVHRFENINAEAFDAAMKIAQMGATQAPVVEFFGTVGVVIVVFYGGYGIITNQFTLGAMMQFWFYMVLATNPLNRMAGTYTGLRRGLVSGQRVFELMDLPVEAAERPGAQAMPRIEGQVEFDHVTFAYDEEPVLRDLSFTIKAGEMVALVGPNGAGKTTIVNLIPRFYEPTAGVIRMDGIDLQTVKVKSMREQMAIVPQENVLFSGTLRENIMYGNLAASEAEMIDAAKVGNAYDFIMKLEKGFDSVIGERGSGLSGGQRQRVAIARAVLRNPRILILDEATSALDQQAESEIQEALERLMKGRTTFVIAHRLATIRRADRIMVVNNGRVVEQGCHEELMAASGLYRRLYEAQREQWKQSEGEAAA